MSLQVDGVWAANLWQPTVWADGVWREGAPPEPPAILFNPRYLQSVSRTNKSVVMSRTNKIIKVR